MNVSFTNLGYNDISTLIVIKLTENSRGSMKSLEREKRRVKAGEFEMPSLLNEDNESKDEFTKWN
jgi:hypothetical protein